jgi:hypothetical protein
MVKCGKCGAKLRRRIRIFLCLHAAASPRVGRSRKSLRNKPLDGRLRRLSRFTKGIGRDLARPQLQVEGDQALADGILGLTAIIGCDSQLAIMETRATWTPLR